MKPFVFILTQETIDARYMSLASGGMLRAFASAAANLPSISSRSSSSITSILSGPMDIDYTVRA